MARRRDDNPALPPTDQGAPMGLPEKPAKFGVQKRVGDGLVPRVIDPLERVDQESGYHRYKVRCNNYESLRRVHYILAERKEDAQRHYLDVTGIQKELDRIKEIDPGAKIEQPELVVTVLRD